MFKLSKTRICILILVVVAICMLIPNDAYAAFEGLKKSGQDIFKGLRKVIYPASAIGIICICIGGFFGNINWKWLTAIFVGLIVIALCGLFIEVFVGSDATSVVESSGSILSGS